VASLSVPGDAILSLGTSTTFLLSIPPSSSLPKRFTTSHLLAHPTTPGAHIAMLCYKNGALAREQVRDSHAGGDWDRFNKQVEESPPDNNGYMGLYFPIPEIIPPNILGTFLFSFHNADNNPKPVLVDSIPSETHPRAILESQFLSIRSHIAGILPPDTRPFRRLVMTGGSSVNHAIQQVVADVFGTCVYVTSGFGNKEAACAGGAILAKMAWWKQKSGGRGTADSVDFGVANGLTCVAEPNEEASRVYDKLLEVYRSCEEEAIRVHSRDLQ
jgi:xylulokinase